MSLLDKIEEKLEGKSILTKKNYKIRIKKLIEGIGFNENSFSFTDKYEEIQNYLDTKSPSIKKQTYQVLMIISNDNKSKEYWKQQLIDINKELNTEVDKNILTDKERDNYITYPELKKLKIKKRKNEIKYILLELIKLPFTPRTEYKEMKFGKDDDVNNWIDLERGVIILNKYKTQPEYGKLIYELPKQMLNKLKQHKKYIEKNHLHDYLLGDKVSQENYSRFLTNMFKEITDKEITNNLIRKIKGNYFYTKRAKIDLKLPENKKDEWYINHFQHSYNIAMKYYKKLDLL
jgi:hypothetical protein